MKTRRLADLSAEERALLARYDMGSGLELRIRKRCPTCMRWEIEWIDLDEYLDLRAEAGRVVREAEELQDGMR